MKLFRTSFPEQKIELKGSTKMLQKMGLGVLGAGLATGLLLISGTITISNKILNEIGIESQYHENKVFAFDINEEDKTTGDVTQNLHFLYLTKEGDYCNEYKEIEKDGRTTTYTMVRYDGMDDTIIPIHEFLKENGYENNMNIWYSETQLSILKSQIENDRLVRNEQLKKEEEIKKIQPIDSIEEYIWQSHSLDKTKLRLDEICVLDMYDSEQHDISSLHFLYPVRIVNYRENGIMKTVTIYREIVEDEYEPIYIQTDDGSIYFDYESGNEKCTGRQLRLLNPNYEMFISDKVNFDSPEKIGAYLQGYSKDELLEIKSEIELKLYEKRKQEDILNENQKTI